MKTKKLKRRILFRTLSLLIGALIIMAGISVTLNYVGISSVLNETMSETVSITALQLETRLGTSKAVVSEFGLHTKLSSTDSTDSDKLAILKGKADIYDFIDYGMADLNGKTLDGKDISDKDYFRMSKDQQEAVIGTPFVEDGSCKIYVAAPIWQSGIKGSNMTGIVYMAVDGTFLSNITNQIQIGKNGYTYVIDQNGTIIADNDYDRVLNAESNIAIADQNKGCKKRAEAEQKALGGEAAFVTYTIDGVKWIEATSPINNTNGWAIGIVGSYDEFTSMARISILCIVAVLIVSTIIGVVIMTVFTKEITDPVFKVKKSIEKLSVGDLNTHIECSSNDELGELAESVNDCIFKLSTYIKEITTNCGEVADGNFNLTRTVEFAGDFKNIQESLDRCSESLSKTIDSINTAAVQVKTGSDQIAAGAQSLSQGTTEQASSIQELASLMETLDSEVKETAANAGNASNKSGLAGERISKSNESMQEMIKAMENITDKSNQINNIIKTIDDIAFQTNILALNAAVEAARAGAAGKGFAVVADEVRNLATKSAEAVKNTTKLIQETIDAVNKGSEIAGSTAANLNSAVGVTAEAVSLIEDISKAADKQSEMLNQVTVGINQISTVVQTNAATAEESAASSEELSGQSSELQSLTSRFHLANVEYTAEDSDNGNDTNDTKFDVADFDNDGTGNYDDFNA